MEKFARSLRVPLQSLLLTGGEPTLHKELPEICRIFDRSNGTKMVTIPTNGIQTERILAEMEEILKTCRLRLNVQVSIDGLGETHDRFRGVPGNFEKAVATARGFKALKPRYRNLNNVSIITSIAAQNVHELEALLRFVRDDLGLLHKFQFVRGSHTDVKGEIASEVLSDLDPWESTCTAPAPEQMIQAYELIRTSKRVGGDSLLGRRQLLLMSHAMRVLLKNEKTVDCLAGQMDGVVYSNGDVAMCEMTKPFTNLRHWDMDFYRMWNSDVADARRAQIRRCYCTHPCNLSTSMSYNAPSLVALSERSADGWEAKGS
jgi:MoaA/NifB/PqqE/SkfB family radical SAM enzyme